MTPPITAPAASTARGSTSCAQSSKRPSSSPTSGAPSGCVPRWTQLVAQLAKRFGARPALRGPAETARKAVTKVLRTQIGKLLDVHPALGRHLRDTVRMGTVCVYAPPTPVEWDVGFGPG